MTADAAIAKPLRLTFIGSGQVATHLSLAFERAGHLVQLVYSRQLAHASHLASQLQQAIPTDNLDFRGEPVSDLYVVSVSDAAVAAVMAAAHFPPGSRVVHTAGSLPISVLDRKELNLKAGVFYPIQTFSRYQPVNISETPIALEATEPEVANVLKHLASSISHKVIFMPGSERKILHLAAVFACNFTNHLLGISREILTQNNLEPGLLTPLIQATINKATQTDPFTVQTGPAVRRDENILQQHLQLLSRQPEYREIYALLTQSIQSKIE